MNNLLVSIYAGKAENMINSKKPSDFIPFKGEFPLLRQYQRDAWNDILNNQMYVEECPKWAQDIMIKGARMFDIERGFRAYLKQNNISEEMFNRKSNADKSTELIRFFNASGLTLDSLKISLD